MQMHSWPQSGQRQQEFSTTAIQQIEGLCPFVNIHFLNFNFYFTNLRENNSIENWQTNSILDTIAQTPNCRRCPRSSIHLVIQNGIALSNDEKMNFNNFQGFCFSWKYVQVVIIVSCSLWCVILSAQRRQRTSKRRSQPFILATFIHGDSIL